MRKLISALMIMFTSFLKPTPSPKGENPPQTILNTKEWHKKATNTGIENGNIGPLHAEVNGVKEQLKSDEDTRFKKEITNIKNTLKLLIRKLEEPIADRLSRVKTKLSPANDKIVKGLNKTYSTCEQQYKRLTIKVQNWKKDLNNWVEANGGKPETKTVFDTKPAKVFGIAGLILFESPFTFTALQTYGVASNITLILLTISFSVLIALCADFACRFLSERSNKAALVSALAGLTVCCIVIGIRMNAPEPTSTYIDDIYTSIDLPQSPSEPFTEIPQENTTTSFEGIEPALNITTIILYLLGLTFAYLTHRNRPFWSLSEKIEKGEKELDNLKQQLDEKQGAYKEAENEFDKKVEQEVQNEIDHLQSQHDDYSQKLEQLQIDHQHALKSIDAQFQQIIADVNAAHQEGKRHNI